MIGQDQWENAPQERPDLTDYGMRDLTKIVVCKKDTMINAIFFYVPGQDNYKNVLASSECFACINYDAMLKDPASKGCTSKTYEIAKGDRWVGIKYR